jgi:hypothetical protein
MGEPAPVVIGWKEFVTFPDWHGRRVKAKVDTGARTSAIDVAGYRLLPHGPGRFLAELRLSLDRRRPERVTLVTTPVLKTVCVTSSTGQREERPVVATRIRIGPVIREIELTVTNREGRLFRMLLGRKALEGAFIVDVSRKYVQTQ